MKLASLLKTIVLYHTRCRISIVIKLSFFNKTIVNYAFIVDAKVWLWTICCMVAFCSVQRLMRLLVCLAGAGIRAFDAGCAAMSRVLDADPRRKRWMATHAAVRMHLLVLPT
jgi:hypothetical protein